MYPIHTNILFLPYISTKLKIYFFPDLDNTNDIEMYKYQKQIFAIQNPGFECCRTILQISKVVIIAITYHAGIVWSDYINTQDAFETKFKLFKEIVCKIAYLHTQGLIHGDIHPGNILISPDNNIIIIDWISHWKCVGIKNIKDGAVYYSAPEKWCYSQDTMQMDVYSLGIMLYELITGSVCFGIVNLHKDFKLLNGACSLISKATHQCSTLRFDNAIEFYKALYNI